MFTLKAWLGSLLLPLPLAFGLLTAGLLALLLGRRRGGMVLAAAAVVLILGLSGGPLPGLLLSELENEQAPLLTTPAPARYIVVLGSGHLEREHPPALTMLRPPALARLVEGVRLYRQNPGSLLVFSGSAGKGGRSHPSVMRDAAVELGVPQADIEVIEGPRDTAEEAAAFRRIADAEPFALVTSAAHMRRALALFRGQGLDPWPAPADYLAPPEKSAFSRPWRSMLPSARNLEQSERVFHETLGLWWARLRGQI